MSIAQMDTAKQGLSFDIKRASIGPELPPWRCGREFILSATAHCRGKIPDCQFCAVANFPPSLGLLSVVNWNLYSILLRGRYKTSQPFLLSQSWNGPRKQPSRLQVPFSFVQPPLKTDFIISLSFQAFHAWLSPNASAALKQPWIALFILISTFILSTAWYHQALTFSKFSFLFPLCHCLVLLLQLVLMYF